jgi:type II secretory pathway predicted ATPase ExeA
MSFLTRSVRLTDINGFTNQEARDMYEAFFGMQQRPFTATGSVDCYFPAQSIEHARQTIQRGIERAAGPAVVIGPAGSGKTLLLRKLGSDLADRFEVALLANGRLRSVRALLQNILFELQLPFRGLSEGELRLTLLDHLNPDDQDHSGLLLCIDEAQAMPSRLLDELRMLTNLVRGGQPRVRLVLAGDLRLEERLANPRLASFQQRIAARCYLQPLSLAETKGFVRHQLARTGVQSDKLLDDAALSEVHQITGGTPRLINQLCDHSFLLASQAGQQRLTESHITAAWADLQQLPLPAKLTSHHLPVEGESGVVEFGTLDDTEPVTEQTSRAKFSADLPHHDILCSLDVLEDRIAAALSADERALDPLETVESEIDAAFAQPVHPFGGVYEEEEVVIDRYASLEAKTMHFRPHVTSPEGREIAALMGASSRRKLGIVSAENLTESTHTLGAEAFDDPFDPASDPVLPDNAPPFSDNQSVAHPELVVVDSEGTQQLSSVASAPTGRAQRQEYHQLFARLRRGG